MTEQEQSAIDIQLDDLYRETKGFVEVSHVEYLKWMIDNDMGVALEGSDGVYSKTRSNFTKGYFEFFDDLEYEAWRCLHRFYLKTYDDGMTRYYIPEAAQ